MEIQIFLLHRKITTSEMVMLQRRFDAVLVLQISEVVTTLQTGSRGTQACINAAGTIDGVIADLETTVMFASAGTLNPEPGETFANHRLNKLMHCCPCRERL